jgi:hypothetical protein
MTADNRRASLLRGSLWSAPDLWKTHRTRFPQGRWTHRTRPHAPQAHFFLSYEEEQERKP